ncbi:MAG: hypothetical protein A2Y90_00015 [Chloroflexi bacterium RBG_13_52_12]|nr:MAG: hypothetical protein A2Y90_00015 [Chloroflexi bacterium RBG_13_52_12]
MKPLAAMMSAAEMALIAALGGIGAYAFLTSSAYDAVRKYGESHNFATFTYLPLIIWGVITAFGVLNIILRNRGSGSFIWLVIIFTLPSLLGQNTVNWPGIFGLNFELTTSLGFSGMLALGVLIITGYVVLDYLRVFKQSRSNLVARQATPTDIESVAGFSYLSLLMAVLGALAATALIAFLARNLELLVLDYLRKMPWNIVFIGLFCFLLLAFYLYWLGARRRTKSSPPPDSTV